MCVLVYICDKVLVVSAGERLGFGFVQFATLEEAARAVQQINMTKILGTGENLNVILFLCVLMILDDVFEYKL